MISSFDSRTFFPQQIMARELAAATGSKDYLDVVQNLLAYAARCPMSVPDKADGRTHPTLPGVVKVPLVNADGCYALIDAEDYPLVQRYRWSMQGGYAIASSDGKRVLMHRLILMLGSEGFVDHQNHEPADNRKANLRVCTHAENMQNARRPRNVAGVKGVTKRPTYGYQCSITKNGERFTKSHRNFEDACAWIEQKRAELHGDFACHV